MKKSKYGYIEFVDRRKLKHDGWDDNIEPEIRKPTPAEREEILLNLLCERSGKPTKVSALAEAFAVSDRTIQKLLKKFEDNGLIKRESRYSKTNWQRSNIIHYIGPEVPAKGTLTLEMLYDPDNSAGFRDWHWDDYKFIPGVFDTPEDKELAEILNEDLQKRKKLLADKRSKLRNDLSKKI